ncbi:hypothetical protein F8538_01420 [Edwardsiella ictaluri]|uniref:lecithin retinol acyltransferase family protein n=1 Tax=Edwardsiella ictaluri TaxID=67780 RepID=UPI0009C17C6C|nr:lecithin retinol acyltransferase family protein [Edwardsiella ictaluri]ARD40108.1 hypothetical protein B6E78_12635 [Edwardsiella ictaluri]QPW25648.1 hypothetical protein F8538_01420 [Edwardsiella ictaluri]
MGLFNGIKSFLTSLDNICLYRGTALRVESSKAYGLIEFDHYGIYAGNREVIHLINNGEIVKESIEKFINEQAIFNFSTIDVIDFRDSIDTEESYQIALFYLNKKCGYDLTHNNCEHFVSYCRTRIGYSSQSRSYNNDMQTAPQNTIVNIPRLFSKNDLEMYVVTTVKANSLK